MVAPKRWGGGNKAGDKAFRTGEGIIMGVIITHKNDGHELTLIAFEKDGAMGQREGEGNTPNREKSRKTSI